MATAAEVTLPYAFDGDASGIGLRSTLAGKPIISTVFSPQERKAHGGQPFPLTTLRP